MKDCVTFIGRHGEENLFLQNVDGYFACQSPADARLISAAPELLAAAVEALAVIDRIKPAGNGCGTQIRLADAIAKATE
jgi:hypothetical protein